jgi:hypothetical protein
MQYGKKKAALWTAWFMAERLGFEPRRTFWALHALQACSLDQLGHLSDRENYSTLGLLSNNCLKALPLLYLLICFSLE